MIIKNSTDIVANYKFLLSWHWYLSNHEHVFMRENLKKKSFIYSNKKIVTWKLLHIFKDWSFNFKDYWMAKQCRSPKLVYSGCLKPDSKLSLPLIKGWKVISPQRCCLFHAIVAIANQHFRDGVNRSLLEVTQLCLCCSCWMFNLHSAVPLCVCVCVMESVIWITSRQELTFTFSQGKL